LAATKQILAQSNNLKKPQEYINNKQWSLKQQLATNKILESIQLKKNTTPLALTTTKDAKLRKIKCKE
jgi:hypothetical protein